jgi:hypothetical protein
VVTGDLRTTSILSSTSVLTSPRLTAAQLLPRRASVTIPLAAHVPPRTEASYSLVSPSSRARQLRRGPNVRPTVGSTSC